MQIARRTFKARFLDTAFYASWVGLRLLWFPYLVGVFVRETRISSRERGHLDRVLAAGTFMQAYLTGMNYYWCACAAASPCTALAGPVVRQQHCRARAAWDQPWHTAPGQGAGGRHVHASIPQRLGK